MQNELIELAGEEIKDQILTDARSARWYSFTDECSDDATCEQMSICIRFVHHSGTNQPQAREEFI